MVAFSRFAAACSGGWLPKVVRCVVSAAVPAPALQPAAAAAARRGGPSLPGGGGWLRNLVRSGEQAPVPVPAPPTAVAARIGVPSLPGGSGCASNSSMAHRMTTIASRSLPSVSIAPGGLLGHTCSVRDYNVRALSTLNAAAAENYFPRFLPRGNGGGRGPGLLILLCAAIGGTTGICYLVFGNKQEFESVDYDSIFPKSVDWSLLPAFPSVAQRGYNLKCGSCWAVISIKSVEAMLAIKTGKTIRLSIQQIIDCAAFEGCLGNTLNNAYAHMKKTGITTEKAYPGFPSDNRSVMYGFFPGYCQMKGKPVVVRIDGYTRIMPTERGFLSALQSGPIAVNVNVNKEFEDLQAGDVLEIEDCPPRAVKPATKHVILIVGYGTDEHGRKFWKVMNTWGLWWCYFGYGKLRRCSGPLGVAGIYEHPGFRPVLKL